ncbi:hypothetical protein GGI42DRAFT_323634 [Trichoderma sp. SZMC 28013]
MQDIRLDGRSLPVSSVPDLGAGKRQRQKHCNNCTKQKWRHKPGLNRNYCLYPRHLLQQRKKTGGWLQKQSDGSKEPSMTIARARPLSHGQTRAGWCFLVAWLTGPSSGTLPDGFGRSCTLQVAPTRQDLWLQAASMYEYSRICCRLASGAARHCSASVTTSCSRQIRRGRGRLTQAEGSHSTKVQ